MDDVEIAMRELQRVAKKHPQKQRQKEREMKAPPKMKTPPIQQQPQIKLEKINVAAERMGISRVSLYREASAGRLTIIKIGKRASAVETAQVDAWIFARMNGKLPPQCAAPQQENTEHEDDSTILDGFEDTHDLIIGLYDIAHSPEISLTAIEKETVMEARDSLIGLFALCKKLIRRNKTFNAEVTRPAACGRSGEPKASEG